MKYYVDTDTRSSRIYVAPIMVDKDSPWLIWVDNVTKGDQLVKDLSFGKIKNPLESPDKYELIETVTEKLGQVNIYKLLT